MDWLCARPSGFADLSSKERACIAEFSLLWTYFEANVFATDASCARIVKLANQMGANGQIDIQRLAPIVTYFRERYVNEAAFTDHYDHLHVPGTYEPLVRAVLLGTRNDPADFLAVALLIVYRYRNNLFHGMKWAYGVQGQEDNFNVAVELLQMVMEMRNL